MNALKTTGFLLVLALMACTPEKQPIHYGQDDCSYCKMTIVDQRYGAEALTKTGKVYKYDAVECMVNDLCEGTQVSSKNLHALYTVDFSQPHQSG